MDTDFTADTIYSLLGYTEIQDTVYRGTNGYRLYSGYKIQFTGVSRDTGYSPFFLRYILYIDIVIIVWAENFGMRYT